MLELATVNQVRRLLAEGKSHREIEQLMGVSSSSVARIAQDKWLGSRAVEDLPPRVTPRRLCRGCGKTVVLDPCQVCRARAGKRPRFVDRRAVQLRLDLRGDDRERYQEVRAAREKMTG